MSNITYIIVDNADGAGAFAAKFAISCAFLLIIPLLMYYCSSSDKTKPSEFGDKRFNIVKYKNIYAKDTLSIKSICMEQSSQKEELNDTSQKKSNGCLRCRRKNGYKNETDQLTSNDETKRNKYLYYNFNNLCDSEKLNTYVEMSSRSKNDPFDDLEVFVNIVLKTCNPSDFKILLHISSPGGIAYKFECAYSNLLRLKKKNFDVTVLIDDICASGGYMLACASNRIVASPYSKIGSIGVIAVTHNYYELANKIGIEEKVFKTGKYKQGFPLGTKYTDKDIDIQIEILGETLEDFKNIVVIARPTVDIDQILSARVWTGTKALEIGIIDELSTSNEYLDNLAVNNDVYLIGKISNQKKDGLLEMFFESLTYKISTSISDTIKSHMSINSQTVYNNVYC